MPDLRTYNKGELGTEIKSMRFTEQIYATDSGIENTMYAKNRVIVIQDRVRQANRSDLILNIPKHLTFCHALDCNIGSPARVAASKLKLNYRLNIRLAGNTNILM